MENKYFTPEEIDNIKKGSLPFPFMTYEGENPDNIIEIMEVVAISGMATNKGIPNEITIYKKVKGQETKRLIYKLTDEK
jgi:hypothetical protein